MLLPRAPVCVCVHCRRDGVIGVAQLRCTGSHAHLVRMAECRMKTGRVVDDPRAVQRLFFASSRRAQLARFSDRAPPTGKALPSQYHGWATCEPSVKAVSFFLLPPVFFSSRRRRRRRSILLHLYVRLLSFLLGLGLARCCVHRRRRRRQFRQGSQRRQLRRQYLERRVGGPGRGDPIGMGQFPIEFALFELFNLGKDDPAQGGRRRVRGDSAAGRTDRPSKSEGMVRENWRWATDRN